VCVSANGVLGRPIDQQPNIARGDKQDDWGPFESKMHFELAEFLYAKSKMSEGNIDELLRIWNDSESGSAPFSSHQELFEAIDSSKLGDVSWQSFSVQYHSDEYQGDSGADVNDNSDQPQWMVDQHEVFYRDPRLVVQQILSNPDFCNDMDYAPYRAYAENGEREYRNLMSGDWAWEQAVRKHSFLGLCNYL
jgi:hypothetical protein